MSNAIHPAAPHHLPAFITAPGETDVFLVGTAVVLALVVLFLGSLYFRLHSLPERIAHGASKVQFQLVAVLCLLALFTHQHLFWVAALVLALVPVPDFWTPLSSMAESLAKMVTGRVRPGELTGIPAPDGAARAASAGVEAIARQPTELGGPRAADPEVKVLIGPADPSHGIRGDSR